VDTTKRELLKALLAGAVGLGGARAASVRAAAKPALKNWVWIGKEPDRSTDDWKRELARIREAGVHAVVPEIYDGRHAYFGSRRLPVKGERLERLLPLAREAGLEVHAWMWCLPCLVEDVMKGHPDWYNVNARGESALDRPAYVDYYRFLDPARPEVREFVRGTVQELAAIGELSGVHLDYIRHPDAILPRGLWAKYGLVQDRVYPQFDYGYTEYSRARFKQQHGVDPLTLADPERHPAWMRYRWDSVTDLVNGHLVPAAREKKKTITAAVFPGPSLARVMVRQDWGRWDLDGFLPMLYHSFYEAGPDWVERYTREAVRATRRPVYSGLFVPPLDERQLAVTVEKALAGGASGVALFSLGSMNEGKWSKFGQATGRPR
jgi:uncharacterized lipoprotein YddW (UPF0748 family)